MIENECFLSGTELQDTGFAYTLSLIGGKYKMSVLYILAYKKIVRHNAIKRIIGIIPFKTLSVTLKELETDGLIIRTAYAEIPPRVEYSLSERGKSIIPVLDAICVWGEENRTNEI